jgi:hypothetical protein
MTRSLEQVEEPHVMNRSAQIVERIAGSKIYKDYERAFSESMRLRDRLQSGRGMEARLGRQKA